MAEQSKSRVHCTQMSLLMALKHQLHEHVHFPGGSGRGIVIVGGGPYLPSAYVAIRHLRRQGCELPIQLWHLGEREIPPFWRDLASPWRVETVDALRATGASDFKHLGGWESKLHAIVACPFEQVLLLDADNLPLVNPDFLFDSESFARHGQVFWPDFYYKPEHRYAIRPRAWRDLGLPPRAGLEIDSGQLLIDRSRCRKELQACRTLNIHSDECYDRWTWGDKDTFTLAWLLRRGDYYAVPVRPRFIQPERPSIFWQHWIDGRKLYQHQRKWLGRPQDLAGRLLEGELLQSESLAFLQEFWDAAGAAGQEILNDAAHTAVTASRRGKSVVCSPEQLSPEALRRLATAAFERGDLDEAVEHLTQAVTASPSHVAYRVDLAALLSKADRPAEAIPHLVVALQLKGDIPEVHNNLGVVLEQLGRFSEAAAACRNAVRLRADFVQAHHNLGKALRKAGDPQGSLEAFKAAVRLRTDSIAGHDGLVAAADDLGDANTVCAELRRLVELQPNAPSVRSSLLYTLHYNPAMGPAEHYEEARQWDHRFGLGNRRDLHFENDRTTDRRIRIGYLSPDLREHTVTRFIGAALKHHDRDRFEVFCYSNLDEPDEVTERIRSQVEHWRDIVGMPDEQAERIIREDRIDLLIDLRGHGSNNRLTLLARRPAPVQLNMVGYFDTTGLSAIDYRVTDAWQDPPGQSEQFHSERLIRMPHSFWCYSADQDAPPVTAPPSEQSGTITFGSLNKLIKVNELCGRLWAGVLEAVPDSRLLLAIVSEQAADAIRARLAAAGLPADRLVLLPKAPSRREYLNRFGQIDIALDPFPFNGITTTCDGLWMGVPCVSLAGPTTVSRAGRSILHAAGLGELSTSTPQAFVRVAAELCHDRSRLRELRLTMRQRLLESPLMDHLGSTRALEREYLRIWSEWRSGLPEAKLTAERT
jgi:predicted O-linked N-acetylglucosamine transferase (SPINDLY family)